MAPESTRWRPYHAGLIGCVMFTKLNSCLAPQSLSEAFFLVVAAVSQTMLVGKLKKLRQ
jgi:hypothetical protein